MTYTESEAECDKCGDVIEDEEETYCRDCIDKLRAETDERDRRITMLEAKIMRTEKESIVIDPKELYRLKAEELALKEYDGKEFDELELQAQTDIYLEAEVLVHEELQEAVDSMRDEFKKATNYRRDAL